MTGSSDTAQLKEYVLFLNSLGITDGETITFLAPLLRDLYRMASRVDKYLEPHGAAFHSAISRLLTTDNPMDAPTHVWIRFVDQLGFFTDNNAHAQRIVNIGLSFAYRHKLVDALAGTNALALESSKADPGRGLKRDKGDVPRGGVVVAVTNGVDGTSTGGAGAGSAAPAAAAPAQSGAAVPVGGTVLTVRTGAPPATSAGTGDAGAATSPTRDGRLPHPPPPPSGAPATANRVDEGMLLVPSGDSAAAKSGLASGVSGDADQGGEDGNASDSSSEDADGLGLAENVHEFQPTVTPTSSAVTCVSFVLQTVMERKDALEVLRQLLDDSLLCLVRKRRQEGFKFKEKTKTGRPRSEWTDVNDVTDRWWATWEARRDSINCLPEVGTVASVANPTRRALTSRWCLIVKTDGVNDIVKQLKCRSRYFSKEMLAPTETVIKLYGKKKLRLTVVIAAMLLLASKEAGFDDMLMGLASTGRASKEERAGLTDATRHEFLTPAPAVSTLGSQPTQGLTGGGRTTKSSTPVADVDDRYAAMDVQLAAEETATAADNRARRMQARRSAAIKTGAYTPGGSRLRVVPRDAARGASLPPSSSTTNAPSTFVGQGPPAAQNGLPLQVTALGEAVPYASTPFSVGGGVEGATTPQVFALPAAEWAGAALLSTPQHHGWEKAPLASPSPRGSGVTTAGFLSSQPTPLVPQVPAQNHYLPSTQYVNNAGEAFGDSGPRVDGGDEGGAVDEQYTMTRFLVWIASKKGCTLLARHVEQ